MNINAMAYSDTFIINGVEHKGTRDIRKSEVRIPYSNLPDISIGHKFTQKSGSNEIFLKIIDVSFLEGGTLGVGTQHPHMLTLAVENISANEHKASQQAPTINIGSISSHQVQVGNNNTQAVNIKIEELVERVSASNDQEAKGMLKKLFENSTVSSIIGAGVAALLAAL